MEKVCQIQGKAWTQTHTKSGTYGSCVLSWPCQRVLLGWWYPGSVAQLPTRCPHQDSSCRKPWGLPCHSFRVSSRIPVVSLWGCQATSFLETATLAPQPGPVRLYGLGLCFSWPGHSNPSSAALCWLIAALTIFHSYNLYATKLYLSLNSNTRSHFLC